MKIDNRGTINMMTLTEQIIVEIMSGRYLHRIGGSFIHVYECIVNEEGQRTTCEGVSHLSRQEPLGQPR